MMIRPIVKISVSKRRFRVPDRLSKGCVPVEGAVHEAGHFLQRLAQAQAEAGQNLLHLLPGIGAVARDRQRTQAVHCQPHISEITVGSLLAVLLLALFGLTMGLKMPNLHWTSEITPVKQGGSVALALLGGWAYALLPGGAAMALGRNLHPAVIPAVFCLLTAVLCALLYVWLKNRGAKVFAAL